MQPLLVATFFSGLFALNGASNAAPKCKTSSSPSCVDNLHEEGGSLLASRFELARSMTSEEQHLAIASWRYNHSRLTQAAEEASVTLDEFIEAQQNSKDACSSRMLESKRSLDGLLHDLKSLSLQVEDHETVLEVETQNLKATELSIQAVEDEHSRATQQCEEEREAALKEFMQYKAELKELKQIAKPSVRYEEVVEVKGMPEAPTEEAPALLEERTWSLESCEAFLAYAKHHKDRKLLQEPNASASSDENAEESDSPITMNCNQQRKKLQRIFTKAYLAVKDLKKEAKERSEDETCQETANAKKAAELVPLVAQRDQAAGRIEYSSSAIAALQPVLEQVDTRVEALKKHIEGFLMPECEEAGEVSKYLQDVRDLIISLQKCPGRDDFTLKIPSDDEPESKYFQRCFSTSYGKICGTRMREGGKKGNGHYMMTPKTAKKACIELQGTLCTYDELEVARKEGVEWCAAGFVADKGAQMYFPMQSKKKGCGHKGMNTRVKTYGGEGKANAWCCYHKVR
eukprot:gnl/MRDRNA2_/MRDRNA2_29979_c0_seq2.p1 gnl/MRDRNA2_/MRDRNA2_29979_c0~~gnl/MRDRNA2_/MRDRNA2_29979_c0_seq2.p1  ORF type:complete len:516 (-),score=122.32 gnl/MRDRNA2_/MRDRNA2_29979_c0_seq2:74-1621(-)